MKKLIITGITIIMLIKTINVLHGDRKTCVIIHYMQNLCSFHFIDIFAFDVLYDDKY